jgi:PAS domain S-box-containing protein
MSKRDIEKLAKLTAKMNATDAALYKYQTELSSFFMESPFPMWIKDLQGCMLFINKSYAENYGISPDDYLGVNDAVFWGDAAAAVFRENDQQVLSSDKDQVFKEFVHTRKHPEGVHLLVHKWPVRRGGKTIAIAGIVTESITHE